MKEEKRHVGRPTNEEVRQRRNKKIIKVLIPLIVIVVIVLLVTTKVDLKNIKGAVAAPQIKKVNITPKYIKHYYAPNRYSTEGKLCFSVKGKNIDSISVYERGENDWDKLLCQYTGKVCCAELLLIGDVKSVKVKVENSRRIKDGKIEYKEAYSEPIDWVYVPPKPPKLKKVKAINSTSINLTWYYISDEFIADEVEVEYATNKNFTNAKKETYDEIASSPKQKVGITIQGLNPKTKYYFRVKSWIIGDAIFSDGNVYSTKVDSKYSNVKSAKTK